MVFSEFSRLDIPIYLVRVYMEVHCRHCST